MMLQEPFDFVFEEEDSRKDNFVISGFNREAFALVDSWPEWIWHAVFIYGPQFCGKSHLAEIWRKKTDAMFVSPDGIKSLVTNNSFVAGSCYYIDNIELFEDESDLFHLFNKTKEEGCYLLITSSFAPNNLEVKLPDLKSRLNAIPSAKIDYPDEELIKTILLRHFTDRQLSVGADVIEYLVKRVERSFVSLNQIVQKLDRISLKEKRNITVPFVREILINEAP